MRALMAVVAAMTVLVGAVGAAPEAEAATKRFTSVATPTIVGTAQVGSTLTAKHGRAKPSATSWTYRWYRSGKRIAGVSGKTYRLVAADLGKRITVKAVAKRHGYSAKASKQSRRTATVKAGTLSASTPAVTGKPEVGTMLAAQPGRWTTGTKLAYQWLRNGTAIAGATGATYLLGVVDLGAAVSVRVSGRLAGYASRTLVSAAVGPVKAVPASPDPDPTPDPEPVGPAPVEPGVPATDTPTIWGLPHVNATLQADPGDWPDGTVLTYQWLRADAEIPGATERTYITTAVDEDVAVSVEVTGSREGYAPESRRSSALSIYRPGVLRITFSGARCTSTPHLLLEEARPGAVVAWSTGQRTVLPGDPYTPQAVSLAAGTIPSGNLVLTVTAQVSHFRVSGCPLVVNSWDEHLKLTSLEGSLSLAEAVPAQLPTTVTSLAGAFDHNVTFNQNINSWDTSRVTSMAATFIGAAAFNQPLNNWDTSRVTNMTLMFEGATAFNQPIGMWDTSQVTSMGAMFMDAAAFNKPIGTWNTSRVTKMYAMFWRASSFNQPLAAWDTSSVTDMSELFAQATVFNQPIGGWDTSSVVNLEGAFMEASAFDQPIGAWRTGNVTDLNSTFKGATSFNRPLGDWDTARVTDMTGTFAEATAFNQPIGTWNTSNVRRMTVMFRGATSFNQPLGAWDTSRVTRMDWMFQGAASFNQDLDCWTVVQLGEPQDFRTGAPTGWRSPNWGREPSCA